MEKMKKIEIIKTLKTHYNRITRKQLIKSILQDEKQEGVSNYQIINQIYSYVLKELGWSMVNNTKEWDSTPLDIMEESFPKIKSTKWYKEQILTSKKAIDLKMRD